VTGASGIGIVAIGRNEGQRLVACLASLPDGIPAVYVDSGSSDDSCARARERGLAVLDLDMSIPFTAARARNAGYQRLITDHPDIAFVQFIDGDCILDPDWLATAAEAIETQQDLAIVFGRCRERFPDASLYNAQCDHEWDVPLGDVAACGGNAFVRRTAFDEVGGFRDDIVAGEEPDMCVRLRGRGWRIRRIAGEMVLHDAALFRFSQWWKRSRRSGLAYALHLSRHGENAISEWRMVLRRIILWGGLLPAIALLGLCVMPFAGPTSAIITVTILGLYLLRYIRLVRRSLTHGDSWRYATGNAALMTIDKFAQMIGVATFRLQRVFGQSTKLIEHK
jgi:GT2 family glycosyltransferase